MNVKKATLLTALCTLLLTLGTRMLYSSQPWGRGR
jgi:hypothetical protein